MMMTIDEHFKCSGQNDETSPPSIAHSVNSANSIQLGVMTDDEDGSHSHQNMERQRGVMAVNDIEHNRLPLVTTARPVNRPSRITRMRNSLRETVRNTMRRRPRPQRENIDELNERPPSTVNRLRSRGQSVIQRFTPFRGTRRTRQVQPVGGRGRKRNKRTVKKHKLLR